MNNAHLLLGLPSLVMFYEHHPIIKPTYTLVQPAASFNLATVRAHILDSFEPDVNYFGGARVIVPKRFVQHCEPQLQYEAHTTDSVWQNMLCVKLHASNVSAKQPQKKYHSCIPWVLSIDFLKKWEIQLLSPCQMPFHKQDSVFLWNWIFWKLNKQGFKRTQNLPS